MAASSSSLKSKKLERNYIMGTRHLIAVQKNNEYKVAQYGQWDGYLSGQGESILKFFRENDLETFRTKVDNCFFGTQEQIDEAYAPYSTDGWMTMDQSDAFSKSEFAYLSRNTGANILSIILKSNEPLMLSDQIDFANDSLYCEYAYVIDLDKDILEVYQGFNKEPLPEGARFTGTKKDSEDYQAVKLVASFPLGSLPKNFDALEEELYPENEDPRFGVDKTIVLHEI
jgi:hypothetical protein